jgi:hypothetical protein
VAIGGFRPNPITVWGIQPDMETAPVYRVRVSDEDQQKRRRELLVILSALSLKIVHAVDRDAKAIVGALLHLSGEDGVISTARLYQAKNLIAAQGASLDGVLSELIIQRFSDAADLGTQLITGKPHATQVKSAHNAAASILALGALGVPVTDVISTAISQTTQNAEGAISRATLAGKSVRYAADEIEAAYRSLGTKIAGESSTQINGVFVEAARVVADTMPEVVGFTWNLSAAHPRLDECDDFAGYHDKDDSTLDELPPHPNCLCYLTPVYRDSP